MLQCLRMGVTPITKPAPAMILGAEPSAMALSGAHYRSGRDCFNDRCISRSTKIARL